MKNMIYVFLLHIYVSSLKGIFSELLFKISKWGSFPSNTYDCDEHIWKFPEMGYPKMDGF